MPRGRIAQPIADRIHASVKVTEAGCWEWQYQINAGGYGRTIYLKRPWLTHRLSYTVFVGPIGDGLMLDHLCRNRACCNPDHLEPVTALENAMRGFGASALNAAKTHCPKGHTYEGDNIVRVPCRPTMRSCRACQRERALRRYYASGATPQERVANSHYGKSRRKAAACVEDALAARQLEEVL